MIYKKAVAVILASLFLLCPILSFAAAENLPKDYSGTVNYLIDVRNPETDISSTANKACVISAVAVPGAIVTLYSLNESTDSYDKMYIDGKALEACVGASGLYAQNIELKSGLNNIMVVAESAGGDAVEVAKLEITLLKSNVSENVKSLWQSLLSY